MSDPERIWLEPECCAEPGVGRTWCHVNEWTCCPAGECDAPKPIEYVRADLVAAREAAAAEEMRAAYCTALNTLNCVIHEEDNDPPDVAHAIEIARRGHAEALAICTPDGPSPDALARALDQARREGMEAAARIAAERGAWASNDADAESLVDRLEARGRMDMASEIAAAIRSRGKEAEA